MGPGQPKSKYPDGEHAVVLLMLSSIFHFKNEEDVDVYEQMNLTLLAGKENTVTAIQGI